MKQEYELELVQLDKTAAVAGSEPCSPGNLPYRKPGTVQFQDYSTGAALSEPSIKQLSRTQPQALPIKHFNQQELSALEELELKRALWVQQQNSEGLGLYLDSWTGQVLNLDFEALKYDKRFLAHVRVEEQQLNTLRSGTKITLSRWN